MSLIENLDDVFVRDFWFGELDQNAVTSISSKASSLLVDPKLRRVFSSSKSRLDANVILADITLSQTPKRLLSSLLASQTDKIVIVENCSDVSENVLLRLIQEGHSVFLSFAYRDQISEELYDAITANCENLIAKPDRFWEVDNTPIDQSAFWQHHDRHFTRSNEKAEGDFEALLKRV